MAKIRLFGKEFIIRHLRAPRFKKEYTLATPPPWHYDRNALSPGQVAQIKRFSLVATETFGKKLAERVEEIRARASGPTGLRKPKVYIRCPRLGPILTLAEKYGIPVEEELKRIVGQKVEVTALAVRRPAVIRE